MNTPPRFTEDEIAQMNREAIQIYHDENIALAEKVAALEVQLLQWQELGEKLLAFTIQEYGTDYQQCLVCHSVTKKTSRLIHDENCPVEKFKVLTPQASGQAD